MLRNFLDNCANSRANKYNWNLDGAHLVFWSLVVIGRNTSWQVLLLNQTDIVTEIKGLKFLSYSYTLNNMSITLLSCMEWHKTNIFPLTQKNT